MEQTPEQLKHGFFWRGTNPDLVICVHGFGGSPAEHYLTAQALNDAGYSVAAPCLKGHGTTLEEFDHCHYPEWIASVEEEYRKRKDDYRYVYFVGLSMGGLLSLYMAEKHPEIKGISLMAPALIYKQKSTSFAWILLPWKKHLPFSGEMPGITPENLAYLKAGYGMSSVHGACELTKLQRLVKKNLKDVSCPLIIFQSKADGLVDPKTESYVLEHVSSKQKKGLMFEASSHVMSLDADHETIFKETIAFFAGTHE
jgi:carboxylesterase